MVAYQLSTVNWSAVKPGLFGGHEIQRNKSGVYTQQFRQFQERGVQVYCPAEFLTKSLSLNAFKCCQVDVISQKVNPYVSELAKTRIYQGIDMPNGIFSLQK